MTTTLSAFKIFARYRAQIERALPLHCFYKAATALKVTKKDLVVLIFLNCVCSTSFITAADASPPHTGPEKFTVSLRMVQHSRLIGEEILFLTPSGLRLENPRSHIVFVAKAPGWMVYKFSLETKKYVSFPSSAIVNRITGTRAMFGGTVLLAATCARSGTEEFLGYKLDKYLSDAAFAKKAVEMFTSSMVRASFPKSFVYRTFAASLFPQEEAHILSLLRGLPDVHGVPVDLVCSPFDKQQYKYLSATEIQPVVLQDSQLKMPPGFRQVKTDMDITYDDNTRKDMFDFLEGSDKKKPASH